MDSGLTMARRSKVRAPVASKRKAQGRARTPARNKKTQGQKPTPDANVSDSSFSAGGGGKSFYGLPFTYESVQHFHSDLNSSELTGTIKSYIFAKAMHLRALAGWGTLPPVLNHPISSKNYEKLFKS